MPPWAFRHSWIRFGIDSTRFLIKWLGTFERIRLIATVRSWSVFSSSFASFPSSQDQRFSIGFKSGLLGGHCSVFTLRLFIQFATDFARWHGALSCWNMKLFGILSFSCLQLGFFREFLCNYADLGAHWRVEKGRTHSRSCKPIIRSTRCPPLFVQQCNLGDISLRAVYAA